MNYYRRYVGDMLKATGKLSLMEHGALNVLLDHYYAKDGCELVLDTDEACRLVRAITDEERLAVEKVLRLFFEKHEDGYHQRRADAEIAKARRIIETARENGAKGGRPKNRSKTARDT